MKFKVKKELLARALQLANGVVDKKNQMPILTHVLLKSASNSTVDVVATDLTTSITVTVPAEEVTTEGALVVLAANLATLVKKLPGETVAMVQLESNWVTVKSGRSEHKIAGLNSKDFPKLMEMGNWKESDVIEVSALLDLLSSTAFSASSDLTRYHLSSLLLEYVKDKDTLNAVTTDGHRLSLAKLTPITFNHLKNNLLIPTKSVTEMIKVLKDTKATQVQLGTTGSHIFLKADDVLLSMRLTDATFPPYQQVIPKEVDTDRVVEVNRTNLASAVDRVSLLSAEKAACKLSLDKGFITLQSENPGTADSSEMVDVDYMGGPGMVGINPQYLNDALSHMTGAKAKLRLRSSDLDPVVLESVDSPMSQIFVIMPMRLG